MSPLANSRRGRASGFSLVEVMVSMVFITLSIFAVLSVNAYTLHASQGNRDRQLANYIACSQLAEVEAVLKMNFYTPPGDIQTNLMTSTQFPSFKYVVEDLGFDGEAPGELGPLRSIQVRVFWYAEGVQQGYALSTTYFNY